MDREALNMGNHSANHHKILTNSPGGSFTQKSRRLARRNRSVPTTSPGSPSSNPAGPAGADRSVPTTVPGSRPPQIRRLAADRIPLPTTVPARAHPKSRRPLRRIVRFPTTVPGSRATQKSRRLARRIVWFPTTVPGSRPAQNPAGLSGGSFTKNPAGLSGSGRSVSHYSPRLARHPKIPPACPANRSPKIPPACPANRLVSHYLPRLARHPKIPPACPADRSVSHYLPRLARHPKIPPARPADRSVSHYSPRLALLPKIPPACPANRSVSHYIPPARASSNPAGSPGGSFGFPLQSPARAPQKSRRPLRRIVRFPLHPPARAPSSNPAGPAGARSVSHYSPRLALLPKIPPACPANRSVSHYIPPAPPADRSVSPLLGHPLPSFQIRTDRIRGQISKRSDVGGSFCQRRSTPALTTLSANSSHIFSCAAFIMAVTISAGLLPGCKASAHVDVIRQEQGLVDHHAAICLNCPPTTATASAAVGPNTPRRNHVASTTWCRTRLRRDPSPEFAATGPFVQTSARTQAAGAAGVPVMLRLLLEIVFDRRRGGLSGSRRKIASAERSLGPRYLVLLTQPLADAAFHLAHCRRDGLRWLETDQCAHVDLVRGDIEKMDAVRPQQRRRTS